MRRTLGRLLVLLDLLKNGIDYAKDCNGSSGRLARDRAQLRGRRKMCLPTVMVVISARAKTGGEGLTERFNHVND